MKIMKDDVLTNSGQKQSILVKIKSVKKSISSAKNGKLGGRPKMATNVQGN